MRPPTNLGVRDHANRPRDVLVRDERWSEGLNSRAVSFRNEPARSCGKVKCEVGEPGGTHLYLWPEYTVDFPIMLDGAYCGEEEVGFSSELLQLLGSWNQIFLDHFGPFTGWTSTQVRDEYIDRIPEVIEAVRRELPPGMSFGVHIFVAEGFDENFPHTHRDA